MQNSKLFKVFKSSLGFTMIELLIVISILGILAVAVLSAINPVEQINRGRDTGSRSDAEQLLSAIDRFNAFQGYYPWVASAQTVNTAVAWTEVDAASPWYSRTVTNGVSDCEVLAKLSGGMTGTTEPCDGTDELKLSFIDRITNSTYNSLYIYNHGDQGDSTYVCFLPKSGAFTTEAHKRCDDVAANAAPADFPLAEACVADAWYICLP